MSLPNVSGDRKRDAALPLVCFAVRAEAAPFQAKPGASRITRIALTGMGPANAACVLGIALAEVRPAFVLSCGFAGALSPSLSLGDIVFSADMGMPFQSRLEALGGRWVRFHSAPRIAVNAAEKRALREETGADAVEMESKVIRSICRSARIPSATIRAISDTANEDLPLDFNRALGPDLTLSYARLALLIAREPRAIGRLWSFQKQVSQVGRRLADYLWAFLSGS